MHADMTRDDRAQAHLVGKGGAPFGNEALIRGSAFPHVVSDARSAWVRCLLALTIGVSSWDGMGSARSEPNLKDRSVVLWLTGSSKSETIRRTPDQGEERDFANAQAEDRTLKEQATAAGTLGPPTPRTDRSIEGGNRPLRSPVDPTTTWEGKKKAALPHLERAPRWRRCRRTPIGAEPCYQQMAEELASWNATRAPDGHRNRSGNVVI